MGSPVSRAGAPPVDAKAFEMQGVRREIAAAQNQLELQHLQTVFFRAATRCASVARFNNGIDLQAYLENTYELEPNSDRLFVTREALAVIIGKRFPTRSERTTTVHGVHVRRSDFQAADALVKAFRKTRMTEFFGARLEMETAELRAVSLVRPFSAGQITSRLDKLRGRIVGGSSRQLGAGGDSGSAGALSSSAERSSSRLSPEQEAVLARRSARVSHIDTFGAEVDRVLAIDSGHMALWADFCAHSRQRAGMVDELRPNGEVSSTGCQDPMPPPQAAAVATQDAQLLILDLQARPVRSLPLHLLVLTELYRDDPRYAELVFSSKGMPVAEEKARGGMNLNIRVRFESPGQRATFMDELLSCASAATNVLNDAAEGLDDDDVDAVPVGSGEEAMASKGGKSKRFSMGTVAMMKFASKFRGGQAPHAQALLTPDEVDDDDTDDDEADDGETVLRDVALTEVGNLASRASPRSARASKIVPNPLLGTSSPAALLRGRGGK